MTQTGTSRWAISACSLLLLILAGCKSQSVQLVGAGSTFVYPIMGHWIENFQQSYPYIEVNYQSIGSGGGIEQARAGTVDFGASDVPISDKDLVAMPPILQIPESAGPVCITYNLAGLNKPLQLSAAALAGIFLGKITSWQDPILVKDNPGAALPKEKITVVHRAESSGTTNAFTSYLAAVSPVWAAKIGMGKSVSWPVGLGGKGSEGVTGQVKQLPGTIGYVELSFATENHLPVAAIQNQAGNYVLPSPATATEAITAFSGALAKDLRTPLVNPPASATHAYPITTFTFLIIPKDGPNFRKRSALKQFAMYMVEDGQAIAGSLNYAPLPSTVQQHDLQLINRMTARGQRIP